MERRNKFKGVGVGVGVAVCLLTLLVQWVDNAEAKKRMLSVLSIDGGGVRGIIPSRILGNLESKLQVHILYIINCKLNDACMHVNCDGQNRSWMVAAHELQIISM